MPKLTVEGAGTFEVPENKRLVLALEDDCGIDQMHACGGVAKCTTCRVEFIQGEPKEMTVAERDVLQAKGLLDRPGLRLSCQMYCAGDMELRAPSRLSTSGRPDVGRRPAEKIEPDPKWTERK